MIKNIILIFSLTLLATGCVTQKIERGVSSNLVSYLYPDGGLKSHQDDILPLLEIPLRVGIAFIPELKNNMAYGLSEAEKQELLQRVADKFESDPVVSHIQIIPQIYLQQGKGFVTVEQVASLYDVDVIALVSYDQVSINEMNNWSLTYLIIVGAFIVPGETTEFQTFVDTAVFDVKTRKLLFRAPGIHSDSRHHTGIGFEKGNRKLRSQSFKLAANKMTDNLAKELELFKVRAREGEVVELKYRDLSAVGGSGGGSFGWLSAILLLLLLRFSRIKK